MATLASQGAAAISISDYPKAIELYTSAIAQIPTAVDYYIKRSTAYQRLKPPSHDLALADAEHAVVLAHKRGNKELIAQAQMRRGIALFGSGKIWEAKTVFEFVKRMGGGWKPGDVAHQNYGAQGIKGVSGFEIWERKVKEATEGKMEVDTKEVKEIPDDKPIEKVAEKNTTTTTASETPSATASTKVRHEWYQTPTDVVISLFVKGVSKEKTSIDIQANSLSVNFPLPSNTSTDYDFTLTPLAHPIDPTASTSKVLSTKIEIVLKKSQAGTKWHALESSSFDSTIITTAPSTTSTPQATTSLDKPPSYPTSSRKGPKNWDTLPLEASLPQETSDPNAPPTASNPLEDDDESGDPASAFFKKIYKDADPDTRRAMMKSFQESNGTALSTNWADVGKGKVETSPPDGMEAKGWGE
ncbi:MAG: hypothetical protein M1824_004707 [Vezdaea acicularis]|nr:MAG: hypothetical protein M1824_004707 [Vezdaea acicularis]